MKRSGVEEEEPMRVLGIVAAWAKMLTEVMYATAFGSSGSSYASSTSAQTAQVMLMVSDIFLTPKGEHVRRGIVIVLDSERRASKH